MKKFIRAVSILLFNLIVGGTLANANSPKPKKPHPNVIMIISDDQAWGDFGFMGHEHIQTPHIDKLASQSATFTRGYVPASLCRCSLATLVTGLYPHDHGITSNDPPKGTDRHGMLRYIQAAQTLPDMLAEHGYVSLQTGKWWEGNYALGGFTHGMTHGDTSRGGRHGDEGLKIGREGLDPVFSFIEEAGDKPFFVWYAPFLPHTPHNPPERLLKKYKAEGRSIHVSKYWAMCEWFDETVGELVGWIDESGRGEDTLVVFVTDNGWIQSEDSQRYAPRSKRSPYDGGLRTPIMLRYPGMIGPVRDDVTPVLSLDLIPSILSVCNVEIPKDMPGIDLYSATNNQKPPAENIKRNIIFGEVFTHDAVDIANPASSLLYRWAVEGDWKIIVPVDESQPVELFKITADPHETNDLAKENPEKVRDLKSKINAWWNPKG